MITINHTLSKTNTLDKLISSYALFFLFSCVSHQFIFCLINTHLLTISRSLLVVFEFGLLGITMFLFMFKMNPKMVGLILFIFANCFLIAIFKHGFDPKQIRNFLIPILVIWLGYYSNSKIDYDNVIKYFAICVLLFALFEGFFSDQFQKVLNVLQYQISTGVAKSESVNYVDNTFALNGTRVGGRNLLGFLFGSHRMASIFLESASMSNVGVIIAAWGLAKQNIRKVFLFLILGLMINILSDSRFGLTIITLMVLLRFFCPHLLFKYLAFSMPIFVLALCFYIFSFQWEDGYSDTFKGRLGLTAEHLSNFKMSQFFGMYDKPVSTFLDSGYAFLLSNYGLFFALVMWVALYNIKVNSINGERFKSFIAIIISANLAIGGDAIYALKMSGLMWFLMGILTKNNNTTGVLSAR